MMVDRPQNPKRRAATKGGQMHGELSYFVMSLGLVFHVDWKSWLKPQARFLTRPSTVTFVERRFAARYARAVIDYRTRSFVHRCKRQYGAPAPDIDQTELAQCGVEHAPGRPHTGRTEHAHDTQSRDAVAGQCVPKSRLRSTTPLP